VLQPTVLVDAGYWVALARADDAAFEVANARYPRHLAVAAGTP